MDNSSNRNKKVGTREEVYKGLAIRTAGGLKKEDIIEKQFGTRILYISKKLSDKMRYNFNIIRENNPNYFKRNPKKTLVAPKLAENTSIVEQTIPPEKNNQSREITKDIVLENKRKNHAKTHKLSFRVKENTVRNVFYPELQGMNIKQLKEELAKEEAEEDRGIQLPQPKKEFSIEDMPDIDIMTLE